ncbi:MAG: hypothetical protein ACERJ1_08715 [Halodesulfovibrio sp.]|uniref:hypothetical protein n=1 Tax=Halodesulfovibrio sp. TaxID=1912772 RepID=UPI00359CE1F1
MNEKLCLKILTSLRPYYGKFIRAKTYGPLLGDEFFIRKKRPTTRELAKEGIFFPQLEEEEVTESVTQAIQYLAENELIESRKTGYSVSPEICITAKGIDFLKEDGGFSAKLKTVTVKFDPESTQELIKYLIRSSQMEKNEQNKIIEKVKHLPQTATEKLLDKITDAGLGAIFTFLNGSF